MITKIRNINLKKGVILSIAALFVAVQLPVASLTFQNAGAEASGTPVSDNGITPIKYDDGPGGNVTCSMVGTYDEESERFDEGAQFSGTAGPITWSTTADEKFVTWEGTHSGLAVILKGGPGANVYTYTSSYDGDSGLASPLNNGGNIPELSNITFCWNEAEEEVYRFQFDKEWEGDVDEIDLDAIEVSFVADGEFEWTLGEDNPVKVTPGETTLSNVKEVVTGLPEQCSITKTTSLVGDFPLETLTAPKDVELYGDDNLFTLTVTNTVECDEPTDEGEVLGDNDKKPEGVVLSEAAQVVAPVGAVDAGAGSAASSLATSLYGLVASVATLGYGAARFRKSE
jgi:hypothetical protein